MNILLNYKPIVNLAMKDEFITVEEASKFLHISQKTIRKWIYEGKLPAIRVGRKRLIRIRDIDVDFKLKPNIYYKKNIS